MQAKEEWRSVAMECGGLSGMEGGIVVMLLLLVGNLDYISPIQVCSYMHACYIIIEKIIVYEYL